MYAVLLAVLLVLGYHYNSNHPTRRLKLVRQTGYKLYFSAGYTGFLIAGFALVPALFAIYVTAIINSLDLITLYSDKSLSSFFELSLVMYIAMFSALFTQLKLSNALQRFKGVTVPNYGLDSTDESLEKKELFNAVMSVANDFEQHIIIASKDLIPIRVVVGRKGKVYIGWVQSPDLDGGELTHIKLLPILSGYLDAEQQMHISRNYYEHYQQFYDEDGEPLDLEENDGGHDHLTRFCIILKVEDIHLLSFFNKKAFDAIETNIIAE